jgi:rhodanese-related sulfurtransferase
MGPSASQLVAAAKARIENLSPDRVALELASGRALIVDIREEQELATMGTIQPSLHAPRGLLEFYADPSSPIHLPKLDPGRRIILASGTGARSALESGRGSIRDFPWSATAPGTRRKEQADEDANGDQSGCCKTYPP